MRRPRPSKRIVTRRLAALAAFAALFLASARSHAADASPRTSSLSWVRLPGAEGCVATQELAKRVEMRLGRSVFVSAAVADVSVEGRIESSGALSKHPTFHTVLTLRDALGANLGTRELTRTGPSCDAMTEPLALVIAVMIDPDAATRPSPAPPVETPVGPATAPASAAPTPIIVEKSVYVREAPPVPATPWRIDVGASAASTVGLLPGPNVGIAVSGLLEPPGLFPLEGFGAAWFDDSAGTDKSSASFSLAYAGGALCPLFHRQDRFHLYACAIGELGFLVHPVPQGTSTDLYLAGGLEGRASVRLVGPFALRLGVNAVVPLFRPHSRDGSGELFRPSVVGGTADLGVGVVLP